MKIAEFFYLLQIYQAHILLYYRYVKTHNNWDPSELRLASTEQQKLILTIAKVNERSTKI